MTTLIVGGGWSGLAAAIELTRQAEPLVLIEAAKQLGGRARNTAWHDIIVDNGQHLLVGAYRQTWQLFEQMGHDPATFFQRLPLDLTLHDPTYPPLRIRRQLTGLWPFSMLLPLFKDNGWQVWKSVLRVGLSAYQQQRRADRSVADWLVSQKQPDRLIRQLWEPLCLATLNTPIQQASATVFATVLLTLFQRADQSDLMIPACPLGDTFPKLAENFLLQQGQTLQRQTRVKQLCIDNNQIRGVISQEDQFIAAKQVILACRPDVMAQLLKDDNMTWAQASFPIATVYLRYAETVRLQQPILGFSQQTSQWAFDRSDQQPGLIAVVISGPGQHETEPKAALVSRIHTEIQSWLSDPSAQPIKSLLIREKRATFSCDVGIRQRRPTTNSGIKGLWLAGDGVENGFPATLEGAVLNGINAAKQVIKHR